MPWSFLSSPSIQLGTVEAIIAKTGRDVKSVSAFLMFAEWAYERFSDANFSINDYRNIAEMSFVNGLGDWIFATDPIKAPTAESDTTYFNHVSKSVSPRILDLAQRLRADIDGFLDLIVTTILDGLPDIVGFTTTFSQTVASLNVAARIKAIRPDIKIIFGGANCDGPMGVSLHEAAGDKIDYIVRGESEYSLPALLNALEGIGDIDDVAGLVYRRNGQTFFNDAPHSASVKMPDVPMPIYDEFFERLKVSTLRPILTDLLLLPIENARGCWWGEKHQCTFCGLNGSSIAFRSKSPETALLEIQELSRKYRLTNFGAVDNILDMRYFTTVLPKLKNLRDNGLDLRMFYEIKSNVKKEHVALMRDAGIDTVQPGIESLHSEVLKIMDKGVSALHNVRLLKWAREYQISVNWNLLYGFPGESPEYYLEMLNLLPSLTHLDAPTLSKVMLERFSPLFERPEHYGIIPKGAAAHYGLIFPFDRQLLDGIASIFEHDEVAPIKNPWISEIAEFLNSTWNERNASSSTLTLTRGIDHVFLCDRRSGLPAQDVTLSGISARVYLACDDGRSIQQLCKQFHLTEDSIRPLLDDLIQRRLMFTEDGSYLSLAVSKRPVVTNIERLDASFGLA